MTELQKMFCEWNAKKLNITKEESLNRYLNSWNLFSQGHSGNEFRKFNELSHDVYQVFFDDNAGEIFDSYQFHSYTHFLRMLSYQGRKWLDNDFIVQHFKNKKNVTILDFGCGLAQTSRNLVIKLKEMGVETSLILADIATTRKPFLLWVCKKMSINATFLDCTKKNPVPLLGKNDLVIALEVFEHLHNPVPYFNKILNNLNPKGLLYTDLSDHLEEFMHVSPNLQVLRDIINDESFKELEKNILYLKES